MRSWIRRHGRTAAVVLVLAMLSALDLSRPPREQWTARGLLAAIHLYQATLSPHMGLIGVRCRFTPTCSHYGLGAIRKYGALSGTVRTAWRIARCGPWTPLGTYDPP
jgi:putative membrane protein insertion efficiency factor